MPKKGGLKQFAKLKGGLARKRGVVFFREGGVDTPMHTMDAMSSFGAKSMLHRDTITLDKWFSDSKEKCDYLTFRGDHRISYVHLTFICLCVK